jgi:hypothetical protein
MNLRAILLASLLPATVADGLSAQEDEREEAPDERVLVVEPAELELEVGETATVTARVKGADGAQREEEVMFYSRARRSVTIDKEGQVEALKPGEFTLVARTRRPGADSELKRLTVQIPVVVHRPPVASIELEANGALYTGTVVELVATPRDRHGRAMPGVEVAYASDAPTVASFDAFGRLQLHAAGRFTASAESEGHRAELALEVLANPVSSLAIAGDAEQARTGDVVHLTVVASDESGADVEGVPIEVAVIAQPDDDLGPPASGQVRPGNRSPGDWRFVAETPGLYTLVATCGDHAARTSVRVEPRKYEARLELVGRGSVSETHTSDLWVWEAIDGRDYAVTGTWGANGEAHFWDVTDPSAMERVATITVDARTVNDVKVGRDGRTCVISREGASSRKNGIVIIDVSDPHEPEIVGTYTEGLTGGVHNLFIDGHHVYALSAGRRYDIIDISDPKAARTIGSYELETPGHSIHDVWVVDGLAYSSNWSDGVHVVDVGNGIRGGSPENPVYVADYAYPSGWNHAAYPYRDEETGQFYVVAGDEAFPYGLNTKDKPTYPRGWLHFIDFTDLENPEEVARYEVPEAGTHNFWVEDDIAYVGYYNGGVRVVDLSGELMGDLYRQGREIDFFLPDDPEGHIANAPMVWGPQPHKGKIFFSDWNSGLWAVELVQETGE